jgi:transposase InsO family protein
VSVAGFIATQRAEHQIPHVTACRALGVSQAWFYKWRPGDASTRHARREQLTVAIRRLFAAHRGRYGSPGSRLTCRRRAGGQCEHRGPDHGQEGLRARRKHRRKGHTRPGRGRWRAPDLVGRQFAAATLNCKWYGDRTEIVTDEGQAVPGQRPRRRVPPDRRFRHVGASRQRAGLRGVGHGGRGPRQQRRHSRGDLPHRPGGEYTAHRFRKACGRIGVRQSMGRPRSALDNAVIESWHSTLEFELRRLEHYPTRAEARAGVAAFIDDYNRHRRHSALQMSSPINRLPGRGGPPQFPPSLSERSAPHTPRSSSRLHSRLSIASMAFTLTSEARHSLHPPQWMDL